MSSIRGYQEMISPLYISKYNSKVGVMMSRFVYQGEKTKEISFPLGGIGTGWGSFSVENEAVRLHVEYGELTLQQLRIPFMHDRLVSQVSIGDKVCAVSVKNGCVHFTQHMKIGQGESIIIQSYSKGEEV